jgi:response regulator NasT
VLIAEDEALIRLDLREMLEDAGHEIAAEARDGAEAVVLARTCRPDVIFMDISMPGLDGIEATAAISTEAIAPVVMLTAFSRAMRDDVAQGAGALGYVVKPFSRNDILTAMESAVAAFTKAALLVGPPAG